MIFIVKVAKSPVPIKILRKIVNVYKHLQMMNSLNFRLGTAKTLTND